MYHYTYDSNNTLRALEMNVRESASAKGFDMELELGQTSPSRRACRVSPLEPGVINATRRRRWFCTQAAISKPAQSTVYRQTRQNKRKEGFYDVYGSKGVEMPHGQQEEKTREGQSETTM